MHLQYGQTALIPKEEANMTGFNSGKCPKYEKRVDHLELDGISMGNKLTGPLFNAADERLQ